MKEGRANTIAASRKVEPNSRAVNPGGADALGQSFGNKTMEGVIANPRITPLYDGKGYEAPAIRSTSRKSGSQGSY